MNIYLLERTDDVGYDETAGIVAVADTEEEARGMFPREMGYTGQYLVPQSDINCTCVGVACEGVERGELLRDFNAG